MVANKVLTLVLIRDASRVLLGMKKRGFGEGRWTAYGGEVQPAETIMQGAKRELEKESGLRVTCLSRVGHLMCEFVGEPQKLEVHVFTSSQFTGELVETDDMRPCWFPIDNVPFDAMWPDDKYWFPLFLQGKLFSGEFQFKGNDTILDYELSQVEQLPE